MQLNKSSSVYKVAYGWSKTKPYRSNICPFFWRVVASFFLIWPAIACGKLIDWILIRGLGSIPALILFGSRPTFWDDPEAPSVLPFKTISWWPKIRGTPVTLGYTVLWVVEVATVCGLIYEFWHEFIVGICFSSQEHTWVTLAILGIIIGAIFLWNVLESDWWKVAKAYVKAKKDKVCPYIEFVDAPTTTS